MRSALVFEPDDTSPSRLAVNDHEHDAVERTFNGYIFGVRVFEPVGRDLDEVFQPLPVQLIRRFARAGASHAQYEQLDGGRWYGEVRGLRGVWADGDSVDDVRRTLVEVIEDWAMLKINRGERDIPVIENVDLNVII